MYRIWFALLGQTYDGSEHWLVCAEGITYQNYRADVQFGSWGGNRILQPPFDLYSAITDGQEHVLTTSFASQGSYSLYLDGSVIARQSALQFNFESDQLLIGAFMDSGSDQSFNGIFHQVELWNVALSDYQISLGLFPCLLLSCSKRDLDSREPCSLQL
jgi:hypothetical protein